MRYTNGQGTVRNKNDRLIIGLSEFQNDVDTYFNTIKFNDFLASLGYDEIFVVGSPGNEEYHTIKDGINYLINIPSTVVSTWVDDELYVNDTSGITFTPQGTGGIPPFPGNLSTNTPYGNPHVELVQQRLNQLNYKGSNGLNLVVDGDFGANTEYAVMSFQGNNDLTVTGIVDQTTWNKLFSETAIPAPGTGGGTTPGVNPSKQEVLDYLTLKAIQLDIPVQLALATAWTENGFKQFDSNGSSGPNASGDYGLMQVNIGHKQGQTSWGWISDSDWQRVVNDWKFNVDTGLTILKDCYTAAVNNNEGAKGTAVFTSLTAEQCIARASYSGYNAGSSNIWRYRTAKWNASNQSIYGAIDSNGYDMRDIHFWDNYKDSLWN